MKRHRLPTDEPFGVKCLLIGISWGFLLLMVVLPIIAIFLQAFSQGWEVYWDALKDLEMLAAIQLTLFVACIAVFLNVIFGLAASWSIGKFSFFGKQLITTLIDLPLTVSPVVAGLVYVLVFGRQTFLGKWLTDHGIPIIFATPGVVLVTIFVTFPYVAKELIPLVQQQGNEEEEAAQILGANGIDTYVRVTLPNIKWGLLYGILICTARALGEFGAVSVVSGHIQGLTNTLPLHIEVLYNEYHFTAAFAAASVLTIVALITIVSKAILEWRTGYRFQGNVKVDKNSRF